MTHPAKEIPPSGPMPFEFIAKTVDKNYLKDGTSEELNDSKNTEHSNYLFYQNIMIGVFDISVYTPKVLEDTVNRAKNNDIFVKDVHDNLVGMVKDIRVTYNKIGNAEYGMMFATIEIDKRNPGVTPEFLHNWNKVFRYVGAGYQCKETTPILSFNFTPEFPRRDVVVNFG